MKYSMNQEARDSLRHYLSAAIVFKGLNSRPTTPEQAVHGDAIYLRVMAAFDKWFAMGDVVQLEQGAPAQPTRSVANRCPKCVGLSCLCDGSCNSTTTPTEGSPS